MQGMNLKTKTLQSALMKDHFAKKCMSKALSVQKKMPHVHTDRQTHLSIGIGIMIGIGIAQKGSERLRRAKNGNRILKFFRAPP